MTSPDISSITQAHRLSGEHAAIEGSLAASHLLEHAPYGAYVIDSQYRIHSVNAGAQPVFKNVRPLIGHDFREALQIIWPEPFASDALARFRHTMETGEPFLSSSVTNERNDTQEIESYEWELHRVTLADGKHGVVCYFIDSTNFRRAEAAAKRAASRDAFRVRLADALRPLVGVAEIQAAASDALGAHLCVDRSFYAEADSAQEYLTVHRDYYRSVPSLAGRYRATDFGPTWPDMLRTGRPVVLNDSQSADNLTTQERAAYAGVNAIALIAVPLIKHGRGVAAFVVAQNTMRKWTADEIALVTETAERTWAAAEHAQAETALRESEEKYRASFDAITEGFALLDMMFDMDGKAIDYRLLEANPAYSRQSGLKSEIGLTMRETVGSVDQKWLDQFGQVALSGEPLLFEQYSEVVSRWFRIHASRIGGNESRKIAVVFDDITDRKATELALSDSEKRVSYLLQLGDALAGSSGPEQMMRVAAEALGNFLGADRTGFVDFSDDDKTINVRAAWNKVAGVAFHEAPIADSARAVFVARLRAGKPVAVNDTAATGVLSALASAPPGSQVRAFIGIPVLRNEKLVTVLYVHLDQPRVWSEPDIELVDDTAQRTWAAVERAQSEEALKIADRRRTEFLAILAHELRNPLAPISNAVQILRLTDSPDAIRSTTAMLERQVNQMVRLIDDLLDVSRITRGKIELRRTRTEIAPIVHQAIEAVRFAADAMQHELIVSVVEKPIYIDADAARLVQVIGNLLNNAIKFTDRGGRIELELGDEQQWVCIRVRDNGIGISADQLAEIFDLFRQVDTSLERAAGGLGIGLTLTKSLIELHGGTVHAQSEGAGKGTEFVVRLPVVE